jgi:hypothetical protein
VALRGTEPVALLVEVEGVTAAPVVAIGWAA